jgi:two-component SAPR family response regulator
LECFIPWEKIGFQVVGAFGDGANALDYLRDHPCDVVLTDILMRRMSGLEMIQQLHEIKPDIKAVILSGHSDFGYAQQAIRYQVSHYLVKPVDEDELAREIEYAVSTDHGKHDEHVVIRTFGGFDVFAGGRLVNFKQKKCKELLAVLVDRQGASVSRQEAFAVIYEDRQYDRPMQKQFDAIIRSMRDSLREHGIDDIFEMQRGQMRIMAEKVSCDLYRFLAGDADAVNSYRGEYMSGYSWASNMEGFITGKWAE